MSKTKLQFGLVTALVWLGIVEALSGFVLWFALPSGGGNGRRAIEQAFWSLTRHTWIDIHDWVAVALIAISIVHLGIHWKWVMRMVKSPFTTGFGRRVDQPVFSDGVAISVRVEDVRGD